VEFASTIKFGELTSGRHVTIGIDTVAEPPPTMTVTTGVAASNEHFCPPLQVLGIRPPFGRD